MSGVPLTWLFWANVWAFATDVIVAVLIHWRYGSARANRTLVPSIEWIDVPAGGVRRLAAIMKASRMVLALAFVAAFMLVHGHVRGVYFIVLLNRGLSVY